MTTGNSYESTDLTKTFKLLKEKIMTSMHCLRLGKISSVKDGLITCKDLNNSSTEIVCIAKSKELSKSDLTKGKVVAIAFTDVDYRANLNRIANGANVQDTTSSSDTHSINYGIILSLVEAIT